MLTQLQACPRVGAGEHETHWRLGGWCETDRGSSGRGTGDTLRSQDTKRQVASIFQMSHVPFSVDWTWGGVYHKETAYYMVNQNSWLIFGADSAWCLWFSVTLGNKLVSTFQINGPRRVYHINVWNFLDSGYLDFLKSKTLSERGSLNPLPELLCKF